MGRSEDQAGRNEVIFRAANEQIAARRAELTAVEGKTPFLCECEDEACAEIVQLTETEYARVRAAPTQFVIADRHPSSGEVAFAGEGWRCVEKSGREAEIAREDAERAP